MDIIVAEGGVEAVVPLLSTFQPAEPSYREYVATRCPIWLNRSSVPLC